MSTRSPDASSAAAEAMAAGSSGASLSGASSSGRAPGDPVLARRRRAREAWERLDGVPEEIVVLIPVGEPVAVPGGGDQTFPWVPHPEYRWLTGHGHAGSVLAWDAATADGWVDFVPRPGEAQRVWSGTEPVEVGVDVDELEAWLAERSGRPAVLLGVEEAGREAAQAAGLALDDDLAETLREHLSHARRPKDAAELALVARAVEATARGFEAARRHARPGVSERRLQIELEAEMLRAGADAPAFATTVGAGPDAAVLHFSPGPRPLAAGELVLVDAGALVDGYAADVTRTWLVRDGDGGTGGVGADRIERLRDLHALVVEAEEAAIAGCTVGAELTDLHAATARRLLEGLVHLGLVRGSVDSLLENQVFRLFFPHGLAHLVGLGVRDASGRAPGRPKDERPAHRHQKTDLTLAEGYLLTIEPGLYFIPALLEDPERRTEHAEAVVWDRVDPLIGSGGVRIEDDVLVTAAGPEVLTAAIPKQF